MIELKYNDETAHFEAYFKDVPPSVFNYMLQAVRQLNFSYVSQGYKNFWYTEDAYKILALYDQLKGLYEITFSIEDQTLAEDLIFALDPSYKKVKMPSNKEFFSKHPPKPGKEPFKNYQEETIKFLTLRNRGLASIIMGGGKTYIMCGVIANLLYNKKIDKVMWVCRPEGLIETKLKILFFLQDYFKEEDIEIITINNREIEDYFDKKILLISYNTFRYTSRYYQKLRAKGSSATTQKPRKKYIDFTAWGEPSRIVQILDEGQAIKNDSLQTHFFMQYKEDYAYRYILSGTIGFKLTDYFFPIKYLTPDTFPSFSVWRDYMMLKDPYGYRYTPKPEKAKIFKSKILNELQIVYGEDCLDLPEFQEKETYIDMSPKMQKYYKAFINNEIEIMRKDFGGRELTGSYIRQKFPYLTLFTCDPSLIKDTLNISWDFKDNPKLEITDSLLEQYIKEEGRKVILWSGHPRIINELEKHYKKYSPIIIHGDEKTSVKKDERYDQVQLFRTNKDKNLLICSYVLNSSIDIPEATRTIYWDLIPDNDKFNQSKKRHHRIGQKENTITHYLMFDESVDVYVWNEILQAKEETRELLTSNRELSLEDYKKIFNRKAKFTVT